MTSNTLRLHFKVPKGFIYQPGHYATLYWRGEWHPFTICSSPEEQVISFSIKATDNLDWCSALRKRLINYPLKLLNEGNEVEQRDIKPGTVVKFTSGITSKGVLYSRPVHPKTGVPLVDEEENAKMERTLEAAIAKKAKKKAKRKSRKAAADTSDDDDDVHDIERHEDVGPSDSNPRVNTHNEPGTGGHRNSLDMSLNAGGTVPDGRRTGGPRRGSRNYT